MSIIPKMKPTPILLLILDGFGYSEDPANNAIMLAHKPHWDALWANHPHLLIEASEHHVGLPGGQMGNSEVGHLNIGAGRVVYQDLERIHLAVETGEFFSNPALSEAVQAARAHHGALHILGLLSDGGVHSHEQHLHAMVQMAARAGVRQIYVHAFLDGRDTPPQSAQAYLTRMETQCATAGCARIASVTGRYYAMDRDARWARTEAAWHLIVEGESEFSATSAVDALDLAYARGETDEFVQATRVGAPVRVEDGDAIVFMNFRSDRARALTRAFLEPEFHEFARPRVPRVSAFASLTAYGLDALPAKVAFLPQTIRNGLGEYLAGLGLKQLRIAETEKYPHVTFFFNGGENNTYPGEDRILVPSPRVATYDLKPEMSAPEVTDKLEAAILAKKYDIIICNYANADMVGHTGNLDAARHAIEALDIALGRVVAAMRATGGEVLITADHGNAECMQDAVNQQPHTQHTTNQVPFLYVGRPATVDATGALSDIAPTLLHLMGLPQPPEMTGHTLVHLVTPEHAA